MVLEYICILAGAAALAGTFIRFVEWLEGEVEL